MTERVSRKRLAGTAFVALAALLVFAAVGGTGLAGGLAKPGKAQYAPGQYQYSAKKVTVCHKGKVTIRISVNALPAHKAHGDSMGLCPALAAAKAKAAAAAAAGKAGNGKGKEKGQSSGSPDTSSSSASGPGKGNGHGKGNAGASGSATGNAGGTGTGKAHGRTNGTASADGNGKGNGKK